MDRARRQQVFETVERVAEVPMLVLALAMIPLIGLPLALDLSAAADRGFLAATWFIWAAFALELGVKTYLAPDRRRYLTSHWVDVLIVVIPLLRPLRIVHSLRVLQALRLASFLIRFLTSSRRVFGRHGLHYALLGGMVIVLTVAGVVVIAEASASGRTIGDFPTALYWAATTVTTVGYGDTAPVTGAGRALGVVLMFVGIGLFSMITANVAAFFLESDGDGDAVAGDSGAVTDQITRVERELARLRTLIAPTEGAS